MAELPPPSDTPQIVMNTGTLSGVNVLEFGKVEPGATVQLADGKTAKVLQVRGRRLLRLRASIDNIQVRFLKDKKPDQWVRSQDVATVLRPPAGSGHTTDPEHTRVA